MHSQQGQYCPQEKKIGSWRIKNLSYYSDSWLSKSVLPDKVLFLQYLTSQREEEKVSKKAPEGNRNNGNKRLRNTPTLYDKISYKTTGVDFPGKRTGQNPPAIGCQTPSWPRKTPCAREHPYLMCHHQRPCSGAQPLPLKPCSQSLCSLCNKVSHRGEKPKPSSECPAHRNQREPVHNHRDPVQSKINDYFAF